MRWEIHYDNGAVLDGDESTWGAAPPEGVLIVCEYTSEGKRKRRGEAEAVVNNLHVISSPLVAGLNGRRRHGTALFSAAA